MPVILDSEGNLFRSHIFKKESAFESVVVDLADQIFGTSTIHINKKKGLRGSDILTIPDGYLIDLTEAQNPKLFVIENENFHPAKSDLTLLTERLYKIIHTKDRFHNMKVKILGGYCP